MRYAPVLLPLLAACGAVQPDTLRALRDFDPLTADPAAYALRVALPEGAEITAARLILRAEHAADGAISETSYALEADGDVYRVAPAQVADFRAQQALISNWKAGAGAAGSLTVDVSPCARGAGLGADPRLSVDIAIVADGPFRPLLRDAPLKRAGLDSLPPCGQ